MGEKMFGNLVPGGIVREAFCDKCRKTTILLEYEGQKSEHVYFIPIWKLGPKRHYLLCTTCNTAYFDLSYHEYQKGKTQTREEYQAESFRGMTEKEISDFKKELAELELETNTIPITCPACKIGFRIKKFDEYTTEVECPKCIHNFTIKKH